MFKDNLVEFISVTRVENNKVILSVDTNKYFIAVKLGRDAKR